MRFEDKSVCPFFVVADVIIVNSERVGKQVDIQDRGKTLYTWMYGVYDIQVGIPCAVYHRLVLHVCKSGLIVDAESEVTGDGYTWLIGSIVSTIKKTDTYSKQRNDAENGSQVTMVLPSKEHPEEPELAAVGSFESVLTVLWKNSKDKPNMQGLATLDERIAESDDEVLGDVDEDQLFNAVRKTVAETDDGIAPVSDSESEEEQPTPIAEIPTLVPPSSADKRDHASAASKASSHGSSPRIKGSTVRGTHAMLTAESESREKLPHTLSPVIGQSPYTDDLLPEFAAAFAFNPYSCIGYTPSVQVLSQFIADGDRRQSILISNLLTNSQLMLCTGVALINAIPFNTGSLALGIKLKAATAKLVYEIIRTSYERPELNVQSMGMSHPVYLARRASTERMSKARDTDAEYKYTSLAMYTDPQQQPAQSRNRDCKTHTWTWYSPEELRIIGSQVLCGALYDLVMETARKPTREEADTIVGYAESSLSFVVTTSKMMRDHWQETVTKMDEVMKQCEEKRTVDAYNELVKRVTDSVEAMEMHLAHSIAALTHAQQSAHVLAFRTHHTQGSYTGACAFGAYMRVNARNTRFGFTPQVAGPPANEIPKYPKFKKIHTPSLKDTSSW
ncbi:hypothetical protein DFJ73DRAFT_900829 [Zopfochytrium polystomum]|nr:hypothetical protein DFJ73DRAFT_900829 [Zopfochytrium polystomum]